MTEEMGYFIRANVATDSDVWAGNVTKTQALMKRLRGLCRSPEVRNLFSGSAVTQW